jgi:hypothetical protein
MVVILYKRDKTREERHRRDSVPVPRRRLRVHRKRPGRLGAADERDKLASSHTGSQAQTTAFASAEAGILIGTETIGAVHSGATFALKAGVWFRRARLFIFAPDSQAKHACRQAEIPLIALFKILGSPQLIEGKRIGPALR